MEKIVKNTLGKKKKRKDFYLKINRPKSAGIIFDKSERLQHRHDLYLRIFIFILINTRYICQLISELALGVSMERCVGVHPHPPEFFF